MTEELQLFCEDVEEQLTYMENALITMQESGVEEEEIGALFRAMHTIKGTAGMFGFDMVVGFAHVAESLLSEVRDEKVVLKEDMIEIFFKVQDHVKNLIDLSVAEETIDAQTQATNSELLKVLESFMPGGTKVSQTQEEEVVEQSSNEEERLWHISLRLKPNFFSTGMDILNLISFFDELGEVKKLLLVDANVPDIADLNPTESYIGYEVLFLSDVEYEDIEEIFEFVLDDIELEIFESDNEEKLKNLVSNAKEDLQEILVSHNFYDVSVFEEEVVAVVEKSTTKKDTPKKELNKSFSLRVESSKIDQLINQISEMVIANAKITQRADILDDNDLSESATILGDMLEEIRTGVMNIRMVQVGDSFNKFKRIVHDVAKKVNKEIKFEIIGGDTELDKMVVEKISDPLMHMLRNSIDHGVELPDEREALGKPREGKVTLTTYPDAGTIVIEIRDDGKGLSKEMILNKAIANGTVDANDHLSDKEIYNLIFAAGLSTAKEVSDISGRGVGMDVVKRNIESLRGTIEIDSKIGEGSLFTIRLPLTLAIIDGFLIQSGNTKYIIPLDMIQECIELDEHYKKEMDGNEFINLRDSMLPLLDLRRYFDEEQTQSERENIVVIRYGEYKIGMMVDELFGEFQTVIKPLGDVFSHVPGISGALIIDVPKLIEHKIKHLD